MLTAASASARTAAGNDQCLHAASGVFSLVAPAVRYKTAEWYAPGEPSGPGESRTWEHAVATCLELCEHCARCRHVSVSPVLGLCAWHHECAAMVDSACGVLSGPAFDDERE